MAIDISMTYKKILVFVGVLSSKVQIYKFRIRGEISKIYKPTGIAQGILRAVGSESHSGLSLPAAQSLVSLSSYQRLTIQSGIFSAPPDPSVMMLLPNRLHL